MDNRRLMLLMAFIISLVMLWDGWKKHNQPPEAKPVAAKPANPDVPQASGSLAAPQSGVPSAPVAEANVAASASVKTDVLEAQISAQGGDIIGLAFTQHKATEDQSKNFVLLTQGTDHTYLAQTGLIGDALPTHKTAFQLAPGNYALKDGENSLTVRLDAPESNGVKVSKLLTFTRGSYVVNVSYEITNTSDKAIAPQAYFQILRDGKAVETDSRMVKTFTGPAFYSDAEKYQKVEFSDIGGKDKPRHITNSTDGWVAMVQHYFVSAWLPKEGANREFYTRKLGNDLYSAGVILPVEQIAPGAKATLSVPFFAGPQEQSLLEAQAKGFELVVDYGWLTVVASPLFWVLEMMHKLTGNWGWAIILLTVLIKAAFFPLSAASYKSMAKMKTLTPRLMKLKETYADDRARLNQEMMDLYKREKINPLGGCLPIVIQIPVFIALYWVLLGAVEMRHTPWLGWITDLSAKDPYFILPIIMGVTMLLQTKLNPTPPDPMQAKVMLLMPIIFTFMFLWFPSGLVLYWVVNNTLSIAQQWQINKMIEAGKNA